MIQEEIVRYLQKEKIFCHSVPNEADGRSKMRQAQLVAMGLRGGVADLVVWWPSMEGIRIGYLEVKAKKGIQSERQKTFESLCKTNGIRYDLVRSLEEVMEIRETYKI